MFNVIYVTMFLFMFLYTDTELTSHELSML